MKNFGIGLSLGLIGAIMWYAFSMLISFGAISEGPPEFRIQALKYAFFALMVGGPLVYWIILPIMEHRRKQ